MSHVIITIAREYGSGGRELGKYLANRLGIGYYDRELLGLTAEVTGINRQIFENADEQLKTTTLYKVASNVYRGERIQPEQEEAISNESLFAYQAKVIQELSKYESFVLIGRCGDYILDNQENVVKIFVHAPMEARLERMGELSSLRDQELRNLILRTDKQRSDYYYYHTHRVWNDARNYHLIINSAEMNREQSYGLVRAYIDIKLNGFTL